MRRALDNDYLGGWGVVWGCLSLPGPGLIVDFLEE